MQHPALGKLSPTSLTGYQNKETEQLSRSVLRVLGQRSSHSCRNPEQLPYLSSEFTTINQCRLIKVLQHPALEYPFPPYQMYILLGETM